MGILVPYDPPLSIVFLKKLRATLKPGRIISVGDYVTRNLVEGGLKPDLMVVDGRVMRRAFGGIELDDRVEVSNPPGLIYRETVEVLDRALREGRKAVLVDGEEDLLALPLILLASPGDWVVYGLPKVGLVLVVCDKAKKRFVKRLMERCGAR